MRQIRTQRIGYDPSLPWLSYTFYAVTTRHYKSHLHANMVPLVENLQKHFEIHLLCF